MKKRNIATSLLLSLFTLGVAASSVQAFRAQKEAFELKSPASSEEFYAEERAEGLFNSFDSVQAAAQTAAEIQGGLAYELANYGDTSFQIVLVNETGHARQFEMQFYIPDSKDTGYPVDFVVDERFDSLDIEVFARDFLLVDDFLMDSGDAIFGTIATTDDRPFFGGIGLNGELWASVELKRSWDTSSVGPGAIDWGDSIPDVDNLPAPLKRIGIAFVEDLVLDKIPGYKFAKQVGVEIKAAYKNSDGDMCDPMPGGDNNMCDPMPMPTGGGDDSDDMCGSTGGGNDGDDDDMCNPMCDPTCDSMGGDEDDGKDDDEDETSRPAPDDYGDFVVLTDAQKRAFRASVTPNDSAARALSELLRAIVLRNVTNPVTEHQGAGVARNDDLLGDCAGLPPWECERDGLIVGAQDGMLLVTLPLSFPPNTTSGRLQSRSGVAILDPDECDSPFQEDCI